MSIQVLDAILVQAGLHGLCFSSEDVGDFSLVVLDDVCVMQAGEAIAIVGCLSEVLPEVVAAVAPSQILA